MIKIEVCQNPITVEGYSVEFENDNDMILSDFTVEIEEQIVDDVPVEWDSLSVTFNGNTYNVELPIAVTHGTADLTQGRLTVDDHNYYFEPLVLTAVSGTNTATVAMSGEHTPIETLGKAEIVSFDVRSERREVISLESDITAVQDGTPWMADTSETEPYQLRRSSGGTIDHEYNSEYDEIVGATVNWNQLANIANGTKTDRGITATIDANGVVTLSGTSTASYSACFDSFYAIQGHKYVGLLTVIANPNNVPITARAFNINWTSGNMCNASNTIMTGCGVAGFQAGTDMSGIKLTWNAIDLTALFGSAAIADYVYSLETATSGAGVAWLKQHFPKMFTQYNAYNAGTLTSVSGLVSHDMTGFNQWDEVWESGSYTADGVPTADPTRIRTKNPIHVVGGATYYMKSRTTLGIRLYDAEGNFINGGYNTTVLNRTVTTPDNAYWLRFSVVNQTTYSHDICINLSGSRNGEYEPYVKHSYPLDSSVTLRGLYKLVDGELQAYGDIYHPTKGISRIFDIVDLGTLNWTYQDRIPRFYTTELAGVIKPVSDNTALFNGICTKYSIGFVPTAATADKMIAVATSGNLFVKDTSYTDATAFKTAMSGVYLVYELATPTTESATPYEMLQTVSPLGTEEYVTDSLLPVGHNTRYSNVAPIHGFDEVNVTHTGVNLFGGTALRDKILEAVPNATADDVNGTVTYSASDVGGVTLFDKFKPLTVYTLIVDGSNDSATDTPNLSIVYSDGTSSNLFNFSGGKVVFVTSGAHWEVAEIRGNNRAGNTTLNYELCGLFEGNVSADDFVPYDGTTYHTELEGMYAVTDTNTEPYLMKAVTDTNGGDRLRDKIVGGTVAWNQLAKMKTNATPAGLTYSYDSDTNIVTISGVPTSSYGYIADNVSVTKGHVYLVDAISIANPNSRGFSLGLSNASTAAPIGTSKLRKATITVNSGVAILGLDTNLDYTGVQFQLTIFDLTQKLGAAIADYISSLEQANAGDGVAFFKRYFGDTYYAFDSGTLRSVNTTAHEMVGFNQWDEEWEQGAIANASGNNTSQVDAIRSKNYIPVVGGTTYFINKQSSNLRFYDVDKTYLGSDVSISVNTSTFVVPSNASFMRFYVSNYGATYNHDICINLSDPSRNGEYEPYVSYRYPLDDITLRGRYVLDGDKLKCIGDTYEPDGTVTRKWVEANGSQMTLHNTSSAGYKTYRLDTGVYGVGKNNANPISNYTENIVSSVDSATVAEECIQKKDSGSNYIFVAVSPTRDINTVSLAYELATPITDTANPFTEIQTVIIGGTERYKDNREVPIPVGHETEYLSRYVYGGTLDIVSGVLTVTHRTRVLDGTENWEYNATTGNLLNVTTKLNDSVVLPNNQDTEVRIISDKMLGVSALNATSSGTRASGSIAIISNQRAYATVSTNIATNSTEFRNWVRTNPMTIVYELAEPLTFQLTPHEVEALMGRNNVWSDTGDVKVVFAQTFDDDGNGYLYVTLSEYVAYDGMMCGGGMIPTISEHCACSVNPETPCGDNELTTSVCDKPYAKVCRAKVCRAKVKGK